MSLEDSILACALFGVTSFMLQLGSQERGCSAAYLRSEQGMYFSGIAAFAGAQGTCEQWRGVEGQRSQPSLRHWSQRATLGHQPACVGGSPTG